MAPWTFRKMVFRRVLRPRYRHLEQIDCLFASVSKNSSSATTGITNVETTDSQSTKKRVWWKTGAGINRSKPNAPRAGGRSWNHSGVARIWR
jgi:hypothetical protein